MASSVIAHLTDAHLDQRLVLDTDANSIAYRHEPGEHRERLLAAIQDIARRGISNLVFGGDIGAADSNQWFFETLSRYRLRWRIVLGNHDTFGSVERFYRGKNPPLAGQLYYACEQSHRKLIFLDTSANFVGDRQLAWLRNELHIQKEVFVVFIHHPVLGIDTPIDRIGAALRDRDKLRAVLHRAPGRVVIFCGHYHMNVETTDGNIHQFLTPALCYQITEQADRVLVDVRNCGYRIIRFYGENLDTEVVMLAQ